MKKISKFIVDKYKFLFTFFIVTAIISAILALTVNINYSLSEYMPVDSESNIALKTMDKEFDEPIPNLRIGIEDISIPEVIEYKNKLENLDEVELVMWVDTLENTDTPIEVMDKELTDRYYKNGNALLEVAVNSNNSQEVLNKIKNISNENTHYTGQLVDEAAAQESTSSEISTITITVMPFVLAILVLAVKSWIEPILILISIGIAVITNMGTNVVFGEISFITQAVSGVLQLAVSLDYAVFLLHEFKIQKTIYDDNDIALRKAIEISSSSLISSSLTTIFGFAVLSFMRFSLGIDLGLVLAKGVIFSLLSVIFFLPSLVKMSEKLIDKTEHRDFLPNFQKTSKFILNSRWFIFVIALIVPISFIAQKKNDFTYSMGEYPKESVEYKDKKFIEDNFGQDVKTVILVSKGDIVKEKQMIDEIKKEQLVKSVQSYTEQVGAEIPTNIPPEYATKLLMSENYSRIILNTESEIEGEEAFNFVNRIKNIVSSYYEDYYLLGENVVLEEMSRIVTKDNSIVNLLAIISVALVILINFKSLAIPVLLVLTIESSIWINLSIPYFSNKKLSYIGYLIISSIQLGATVDYAILYTNTYIENRKTMLKKEAIISSGEKVYPSIIPPALILMSAGLILSFVSSVAIVSELGRVLGRGAILSLLMVMVLLPMLLYFLDEAVEKTTIKSNFRKE